MFKQLGTDDLLRLTRAQIENIVIPGAAGTASSVTLTYIPVTNAKFTGFADENSSSLTVYDTTGVQSLCFTNQVATALLVAANGDYHLDGLTGVYTFKKATADTNFYFVYSGAAAVGSSATEATLTALLNKTIAGRADNALFAGANLGLPVEGTDGTNYHVLRTDILGNLTVKPTGYLDNSLNNLLTDQFNIIAGSDGTNNHYWKVDATHNAFVTPAGGANAFAYAATALAQFTTGVNAAVPLSSSLVMGWDSTNSLHKEILLDTTGKIITSPVITAPAIATTSTTIVSGYLTGGILAIGTPSATILTTGANGATNLRWDNNSGSVIEINLGAQIVTIAPGSNGTMPALIANGVAITVTPRVTALAATDVIALSVS